MQLNKTHAIPVLTIGLVSISFASILIKWCQAPSLVIAFYRLAFAGLFYLGVSSFRSDSGTGRGDRNNRLLALLSGLFLSAHFAFWITSLEYTSVASSVVLVQTAPVFVVVGGFLFLQEKPTRTLLFGIAVTLAGTLLISLTDFRSQQSSLTGNLLALAGAIGAAGYLLIGRKLRHSWGTIKYVTVVYSFAAVATFFLVLIYRQSFVNYSAGTFALFVTIALVPQVIGHTTLNWALKYFSAASVSVATLAEPVGASILALVLLGENLSLIKVIGGTIILSGVAIVLMSENRMNR